MHVGSLVSPPQTTGKVTTSPGASVRGVAARPPGSSRCCPRSRVPDRSNSSSSCRPLSSARTQGTAETFVDHQLEGRLAPDGGDGRRPDLETDHVVGARPAGHAGPARRRRRGRLRRGGRRSGGGGGPRRRPATGTTRSSAGTGAAGGLAGGGRRHRPCRARASSPSQAPPPRTRQQHDQQHQPSPPVDGGGELADRVQHPGNASSAGAGPGRLGTPLPRPADWVPVSSSPVPRTAPRVPRGRRSGTPIVDWYATAARDLPWRRPGVDAWAVLVSEVMLQQTPVVPGSSRSGGRGWSAGPRPPTSPQPRRPTSSAPGGSSATRAAPCGCARPPSPSSSGTAAWSRTTSTRWRPCPGSGTYTARAVACFGYGQPQPVVDTNVRRVVARAGARSRRGRDRAGRRPGRHRRR